MREFIGLDNAWVAVDRIVAVEFHTFWAENDDGSYIRDDYGKAIVICQGSEIVTDGITTGYASSKSLRYLSHDPPEVVLARIQKVDVPPSS